MSEVRRKVPGAPSARPVEQEVRLTVIKRLRVRNRLGLHTRPATIIAKILQKSQSEVIFSYRQKRIDARSILNILTLAAPERALITIQVTGCDADETMGALVESFESRFGEVIPHG